MLERIQIVEGDITTFTVDVIVNAANSALSGGGGVDGAIHRAAGSGLLAECRTLGRCPMGEVRMTGAYNLPARYVIHAVGPVWQGGDYDEAELLANCYQNSLKSAVEHHLKTIAFPAISTGIYGYPLDQAASIALKTTSQFLANNKTIEQVWMVCYGSKATRIFQKQYQNLQNS